MPAPIMVDEIRQACLIHARLLDAFIDMTEKEMALLGPSFAADSLQESIEKLRMARQSYGNLGVMAVLPIQAVHAA